MPWREQLKTEHAQRAADNLWRQRQIVGSPQGREVVVEGRNYLNFCSNDYLGLANHPRLIEAATAALDARGTGSGASHLVCGHFDEHHLLEKELADVVGAEKAIVFSTGYMANLAVPQTFLGRRDLIVQDRWNHASLIDAGRYCTADMKRYHHLDLAFAEKLLSQLSGKRKMLATDGVFSMDGDIAPVKKLHEICNKHEALLLVDDAHGFGVLGENGAGTLEAAGIDVGGSVLMMGTLGKAVGSFGAFVAGDAIYIDSLIQFARAYIYTTALPPSAIAASRAAIKLFQTDPQFRRTLRKNVKHFRQGMGSTPLRLGKSITPIQPVILGNSVAALRASELLKQNGILVAAIRPPTVPAGSARLRVTLSSAHTTEDIDRLVEVLGSDESLNLMGESR